MGLARGCVHIYTGDGKGKTSSALGLALRAAGRGLKVCVMQFLKGGCGISGERAVSVGGVTFVCFEERFPFCGKRHPSAAAREKKAKALKACLERDIGTARRLLRGKRYDVVVLDEVINAASCGFIGEAALMRLVRSRPRSVELILTGRGASRALCACADYVTEFRKRKHPYDKGLRARKGIEY